MRIGSFSLYHIYGNYGIELTPKMEAKVPKVIKAVFEELKGYA